MNAFFRFTLGLFVFLLVMPWAQAKDNRHFYRNFWNPTYHIQRLNFCTLDGKSCGLAVADCYCKMMGYEKADKALIDYNVGFTHYLSSAAKCKGWNCNGFSLITCVGHFSHHPPHHYYYREERFVFPRLDHYRIDFCYKKDRGCGQRAAYSYCRRMGYLHVKGYKKETNVAATKALGSHQLCFGHPCNGFSEISCYR